MRKLITLGVMFLAIVGLEYAVAVDGLARHLLAFVQSLCG